MMRALRADHKMNRVLWREHEYVGRNPLNATRRRRGFRGDGDGISIDIETSEFNRKISCTCPALDATQAITVTATDVEDAQRLRQVSRGEAVKPLKKRLVRPEPAIETRNVAQAGA